MPNKNITAYEATLLQKIFLIEYSVEDEKKRRPTEIGLKETDYDNIGTDVGVSGDTIQKYSESLIIQAIYSNPQSLILSLKNWTWKTLNHGIVF